MSLTPLFTSLTVALITRTLLIPFNGTSKAWSRLFLALILQAVFAVIPIVSADNWWVIVMMMVIIDLTHILMISMTKDRLPRALREFRRRRRRCCRSCRFAHSRADVQHASRCHGSKNPSRERGARAAHSESVSLPRGDCVWSLDCVRRGKQSNHSHNQARGTDAWLRIEIRHRARPRPHDRHPRARDSLCTRHYRNLAALGLVLAAKGLARFKDLDKRPFAEYVLIGTLISVAAAILVGVLLKLAIP